MIREFQIGDRITFKDLEDEFEAVVDMLDNENGQFRLTVIKHPDKENINDIAWFHNENVDKSVFVLINEKEYNPATDDELDLLYA